MKSADVDTLDALRGQKPRHGVETSHLGHAPAAPRSIEDTGLNVLFLVDLLLKIMFFGGQLKLKDLSGRSKLPTRSTRMDWRSTFDARLISSFLS